MNYIIIGCFEREIVSLGTANTYDEAYDIMKKDFYQYHDDCCCTELLEEATDEGIKCDLSAYSAWSNLKPHVDADWQIIELN